MRVQVWSRCEPVALSSRVECGSEPAALRFASTTRDALAHTRRYVRKVSSRAWPTCACAPGQGHTQKDRASVTRVGGGVSVAPHQARRTCDAESALLPVKTVSSPCVRLARARRAEVAAVRPSLGGRQEGAPRPPHTHHSRHGRQLELSGEGSERVALHAMNPGAAHVHRRALRTHHRGAAATPQCPALGLQAPPHRSVLYLEGLRPEPAAWARPALKDDHVPPLVRKPASAEATRAHERAWVSGRCPAQLPLPTRHHLPSPNQDADCHACVESTACTAWPLLPCHPSPGAGRPPTHDGPGPARRATRSLARGSDAADACANHDDGGVLSRGGASQRELERARHRQDQRRERALAGERQWRH